MSALVNHENHKYLKNYPKASQKILDMMKIASTDRKSKKEVGGHEGFKVYKERIMDPANKKLKSRGIPKEFRIKSMFGKGGGTPPKGRD